MMTRRRLFTFLVPALLIAIFLIAAPAYAFAQETAPNSAGGEASLVLPSLDVPTALGVSGRTLLLYGMGVALLGLVFGFVTYTRLRNLPVHRSMREISELIYETCKTYLITQGKFLIVLWIFIAAVIVLYFGFLAPVPGKSVATTLPIILLFSLIGMGGSYAVAWFGIRVNTFANSRTAHASLGGRPFPASRSRCRRA